MDRTKVDTYYVDYCNGVSKIEVYGSLYKAFDIADNYASYTQKDIVIKDKNDTIVAIRKWFGVDYNDEDDSVRIYDPLVIENGYYDDWRNVK